MVTSMRISGYDTPRRARVETALRLFGIRLHLELGIVRLVQLVELIQPLLPRFLRREAPVLAMIIPVVGVELLRFGEIFLSEIFFAALMEMHRKLEAGVGFHLIL